MCVEGREGSDNSGYGNDFPSNSKRVRLVSPFVFFFAYAEKSELSTNQVGWEQGKKGRRRDPAVTKHLLGT
jgi:hypothetical protein